MTDIREDIDLSRISYSEDLANDPQWQEMHKQGWEHIGRSDKLLDEKEGPKAESNGFSADTFRSPTGEIVIAFRGTEPTSIKDLWTDVQLALGYKPIFSGTLDISYWVQDRPCFYPTIAKANLTFLKQNSVLALRQWQI